MDELMKNEAFLNGLVDCKTPEDLQKVLAENSLTLEEGLTIEEAFRMVKEQENCEFDEEALDNVSGGIALAIAAGAAATLCVSGIMLCFYAGYAYQKVKNWRRG